ncbi:unnamed protein product [Chrysoparadoxa australica]
MRQPLVRTVACKLRVRPSPQGRRKCGHASVALPPAAAGRTRPQEMERNWPQLFHESGAYPIQRPFLVLATAAAAWTYLTASTAGQDWPELFDRCMTEIGQAKIETSQAPKGESRGKPATPPAESNLGQLLAALAVNGTASEELTGFPGPVPSLYEVLLSCLDEHADPWSMECVPHMLKAGLARVLRAALLSPVPAVWMMGLRCTEALSTSKVGARAIAKDPVVLKYYTRLLHRYTRSMCAHLAASHKPARERKQRRQADRAAQGAAPEKPQRKERAWGWLKSKATTKAEATPAEPAKKRSNPLDDVPEADLSLLDNVNVYTGLGRILTASQKLSEERANALSNSLAGPAKHHTEHKEQSRKDIGLLVIQLCRYLSSIRPMLQLSEDAMMRRGPHGYDADTEYYATVHGLYSRAHDMLELLEQLAVDDSVNAYGLMMCDKRVLSTMLDLASSPDTELRQRVRRIVQQLSWTYHNKDSPRQKYLMGCGGTAKKAPHPLPPGADSSALVPALSYGVADRHLMTKVHREFGPERRLAPFPRLLAPQHDEMVKVMAQAALAGQLWGSWRRWLMWKKTGEEYSLAAVRSPGNRLRYKWSQIFFRGGNRAAAGAAMLMAVYGTGGLREKASEALSTDDWGKALQHHVALVAGDLAIGFLTLRHAPFAMLPAAAVSMAGATTAYDVEQILQLLED